MGQGYLTVITTTARENIVVSEATVTITGELLSTPLIVQTAYNGSTGKIPLPTIGIEEAKKLGSTQPFASYHIEIKKEGFNPIVVPVIHVFDQESSYLPIILTPLDPNIKLPGQQSNSRPVTAVSQTIPVQVPAPTQLIRLPIIPRTIRVHLGPPGSNAQTIEIPYIRYIKNVASSEVYPTWPKEALRANIYAIMSLAMNRVYTEWYRQRGYDYDITDNTAFDQKYTPNGQIYESISNIVDDIFNEYIIYQNHIEPLFAAYCDGREITECVGLKQWGTVDLARQGKNAYEILQEFYGGNIDIVETNRIEDITESYPGRILQLGSAGQYVYTMQRMLNRIAVTYPNIPRIYPVNGVFDIRMEEAVKEFQRNFNLPVDGKIGKNTWYRISYIYNSVRKLSELGREGERLPAARFEFGRTLREGMQGEDVDILQYALNVVNQFHNTVPSVRQDSRFGPGTTTAIKEYQRTFGLDVDGIVGRYTWNHIMNKVRTLQAEIPLRDELVQYPGTVLQMGKQGESVRYLQSYLNEIAVHYPQIPRVRADGYFGAGTRDQVIAFQKLFDLNPDGRVGPMTWKRLLDIYVKILNVVPYPGFELFENDRNQYVAIMQTYLNEIALEYPSVPYVAVDEAFGPRTKEAVQAFQRQFGLTPDGVVGKQTWDKVIDVYLNMSLPSEDRAVFEQVMDAVASHLSAFGR